MYRHSKMKKYTDRALSILHAVEGCQSEKYYQLKSVLTYCIAWYTIKNYSVIRIQRFNIMKLNNIYLIIHQYADN